MNVRAQVRGYKAAVERFRSVSGGQDAVAAYHPLFEALNWIASLDFRIGKFWVPEGKSLGEEWHQRVDDALAIPGFRWARNAVHHDWANALELDPSGRRYPKRYPRHYFEWLWRDATDLPPNSRTKGKEIYLESMAGTPAEATLNSLEAAFGFIVDCMEAPVPSAEN